MRLGIHPGNGFGKKVEIMMKLISKRAQATLELTLVIGALFLLVLGIVRIMGWFNQDMVDRQGAFISTRVQAGSSQPGVEISYSTPELSVLNE